LGVDGGVSAQKAAGVRARFSSSRLFCEQNRRTRVPKEIPRNRNIGKTYTKTLVETTTAMSLIPKPVGVLANNSRGRVSGPKGAETKLGIPPSTLDSRIKKLKIRKSRFKLV
jgi:hypothetical protein